MEEAIKAVANKVNQDYMACKMMQEHDNQKPEVPLTRRERRALKRRENKYGEFRRY